jgi:putative inorganic carbon (hco3(-)) transporter
MAVRAVWRPPWYAWALLGVAMLALAREAAPERLQGHWLILTPVLIVAGVLVLRKLWELNPAILMCAAIVLTIFSGAWQQMGLGGLPLDRLLLVVVLLQFLLRAPGIAQTPRLRMRNVHLLMCLTIMYALGSAVAAGTQTSEIGVLSLFDQLGIAPYLTFLLAPAVFAGRRERKLLLATLVGLGAYLGFTAIFESLGPHVLVFPRYIAHVDVESTEGHVNGPFQNSVAEGIATFGCAVAAAMAFAQWRGRSRVLAAAVAVACIFGCFLTLERGVWIAAVTAVAITALFTRTGRRWLVPGALACGLAIAMALLLSPALAGKTSQRATDRLSVWDRQNQTTAGLRMLEAKPLFGFGWNRYTSDSQEYFQLSPDYPLTGYSTPQRVLPLHDVYLSYAVELGLIGALLWLATLFWGVGGAIFGLGRRSGDLRPWRLGLLALAVFFVVVGLFNPDQAPFPTLLLWAWAGVALGSESLSAQARRASRVPRVPAGVTWVPVRAADVALPR